MFAVDIPGRERVEIDRLVLDYNGTIALDGDLLADVPEMMEELPTQLTIHVLTADTNETRAFIILSDLLQLEVLSKKTQNQMISNC